MFTRVSSYLDWIHENKEPVLTPSVHKSSRNIIGNTDKEAKVNELKIIETVHEKPLGWWVNLGQYNYNDNQVYYPNFGLPAPNRYYVFKDAPLNIYLGYPTYNGPYFGWASY